MITSAQFDQITTPGKTSGLRLQLNPSLQIGCLTDSPIVEVVRVLEVSPQSACDGTTAKLKS